VVEPGREWGTPTTADPDLQVTGNDADLSAAVGAAPGALVRFPAAPDSDLRRAIGIDPRTVAGLDVPVDALALDLGPLAVRPAVDLAVNMVVVGTAPDRLRRFSRRIFATVSVDGHPLVAYPVTTIVVATGEFLRGHDVVPRGHPGDGRAEVQVYAVRPSERRAVRTRLRTGVHVPHPAIRQRSGTRVEIILERPAPLEVDGRPCPPVQQLTVELVPSAYRLLL
jgi:hypothetical protein